LNSFIAGALPPEGAAWLGVAKDAEADACSARETIGATAAGRKEEEGLAMARSAEVAGLIMAAAAA
jgi:hypothetical protein